MHFRPLPVRCRQIGTMMNAPHHDDDHQAISDDDDDDDGGDRRRNHIALSTNIERYGNGAVTASAPYSVSNAAPNFLDLFTTSYAPTSVSLAWAFAF